MGMRMAYWFGFAAVAGAFGGLIAFGVQHIHAHIENWRAVYGTKKANSFYTRFTNTSISLYGYDLPLRQDGPRLCNEEDVNAGIHPGHDPSLSEEEIARRSEIYTFTRDVRRVS